jgi:hypothetical protein
MLALGAATFHAIVFFCALVGMSTIEGFGDKVQYWWKWMAINRFASLAIVLISLFGKGRLRWISLFTSTALFLDAGFIDMMR